MYLQTGRQMDKRMNYKEQRDGEKKKEARRMGIPAQLQDNFEAMSGFSFEDVRIHYNSDKPAQLKALAYTQGEQVYIGPGQEKHLAHELGHVVQQKSHVVNVTGVRRGIPVNEDPHLEKSADMLAAAWNGGHTTAVSGRSGMAGDSAPIQGKFMIVGPIHNLTDQQILVQLQELYDRVPPVSVGDIAGLRAAPDEYTSIDAMAAVLQCVKKADYQDLIKGPVIQQTQNADTGGIAVYRNDSRTLGEIQAEGGFFAKNPVSLSHARQIIKTWYGTEAAVKAAGMMGVWVRNPGEAGGYLVSVSMNDDYEGQGGAASYKYEIRLPASFVQATISPAVIGTAAAKPVNMSKTPLGTPGIYLDGGTVDGSSLIALAPNTGDVKELSFFSGIPYKFIKRYRDPAMSWHQVP